MKKFGGIILAAAGTISILLSLFLRFKGQASVSIIGGAEGPTALFIAGKMGNTSMIMGILTGVILLVLGLVMVIRQKK